MALLDGLLSSLTSAEACLLLTPGQPPRLEADGQVKELASTVLDGRRILSLLSEVAQDREPPAGDVGSRWRLDYPCEGRDFDFSAVRTAAGWAVSVKAKSGATPAAAEAAPEPSMPPMSRQPTVVEGPVRPIESIEALLDLLSDRGGSDLHLGAGQRPWLRVDGLLRPLERFAAPGADELDQLLAALMSGRHRAEFESDNDTDFALEHGSARFRVNVFRDRRGPGAVFRRIPLEIPAFEDLGLPDCLSEVANLNRGLVLVTGPTGSGKSTTLAAIVDRINRTREDHIITIEDPVEFVHSSSKCLIHQREVGEDTTSFKRALRAALREDPDIVLVGEMRDLETVSMAIETAATGHLVFGTLHTTTAPATIERIIGQFPGELQEQIRMMLSDSLRAVVAQTLLERIGGGRVAAFEILLGTPAVSNIIREGKTHQLPSAIQMGKELGMTSMQDSLVELVRSGQIEPAEALLRSSDRDTLAKRLVQAGLRGHPAGATPQSSDPLTQPTRAQA